MNIKKPKECTKEEIELFKELVLLGGQVDPIGLDDRIKSCKYLGFYYSDTNELVGVSALKEKNKKSVIRTRLKANVLDDEVPKTELGYSVTKPRFRGKGINRQLNDKLLEKMKDEKIYATTDNDTMRNYLINRGFKKKGNSFRGSYNNNIDYFEK